MSSSPYPVAALGDAWRQAREALCGFSSVRAREVTATHVLRIGGYSTAGSLLARGKSVESAPFRAGGRRWKLQYYPNGCEGSPSGCAAAALWLLDNRFLPGHAADATAVFRVAILDGDGNAVCSSVSGQAEYSFVPGAGRSAGYRLDVKEAKDDELRRRLSNGTLSILCDVTVKSLEKESRVKCLLREFLLR